MWRALPNSLRLVRVARTLARHDALFPLELAREMPTSLRLLRMVAAARPPWSRKVTFEMPGKPKCAHCGTSRLSETDQTRLDNAHAKVQAAQTAYDTARVPKASAKLGWLVGGWCSS